MWIVLSVIIINWLGWFAFRWWNERQYQIILQENLSETIPYFRDVKYDGVAVEWLRKGLISHYKFNEAYWFWEQHDRSYRTNEAKEKRMKDIIHAEERFRHQPPLEDIIKWDPVADRKEAVFKFRSNVKDLLRSGELEFFNLNGKLYFWEESIEAYAANEEKEDGLWKGILEWEGVQIGPPQENETMWSSRPYTEVVTCKQRHYWMERGAIDYYCVEDQIYLWNTQSWQYHINEMVRLQMEYNTERVAKAVKYRKRKAKLANK